MSKHDKIADSAQRAGVAGAAGSRLRPCPFCGTKKTDVVDCDQGVAVRSHPSGYRVECAKCGATGPWDNEDPVRALNLWDSRVHAGEKALPRRAARPRWACGKSAAPQLARAIRNVVTGEVDGWSIYPEQLSAMQRQIAEELYALCCLPSANTRRLYFPGCLARAEAILKSIGLHA